MTNQAINSNELYRVPKGCSWQCDLTNRVYIQFQETVAAFRLRDFFAFHRKVSAIDIHEMIYNLSDDFDFEIIEAPQQGVSLQLGLCELVQLRDLLDGTKFALKLNSMLHEALGTVSLV
ncbi:hypothetical protein [Salmonirosea aquatica]|uniref:Uncharacterized protein n=1 Tax=Salmonirosea aquatica TaxID=2654236 RepID=A0A7C9FNY9_9BACT|nr:hypothetical protein [Cytophagaceae bacterium SJW1-29]